MDDPIRYPTPQHAEAAEAIVDFFSDQNEVEAVVLTCSCARNRATPDSCLDMAVLVPPHIHPSQRSGLTSRWSLFYESEPVFAALKAVGRYSHVDVEFFDGRFEPRPIGIADGPDTFELEVGNLLVYSRPLWERTNTYDRLKDHWLPYYAESLRMQRLGQAIGTCLNDLRQVPLSVDRGLHFQAFGRLWRAFQSFLQALFIYRRVYPLAYDKWIREQVETLLGMPALYAKLPAVLEIDSLESDALKDNAKRLLKILEDHVLE